MDRHTSQTPPKGEISRSFDQHRDSQETQTRFLPMRNLRYLEGSSRDRVDRANQYLRTLNDDHDTSMSIAKYLRDKNRFTEQDITRIQNFIHMAFQHKSNKDANQGVEAIMNLNYPNDAALEATINWFAEGAPGSVSERETIEQQYRYDPGRGFSYHARARMVLQRAHPL